MEDVYLIVKSIDLLTKEEAENLPKNIKSIGAFWWLQDAASEYRAACVTPGALSSSVITTSDYVTVYYYIRPALLIDGLDALNLNFGQELEIFDLPWIYIDNNKVLAKNGIWKAIFDNKSNIYETSHIKKQLDKWLKDQKAKFNED